LYTPSDTARFRRLQARLAREPLKTAASAQELGLVRFLVSLWEVRIDGSRRLTLPEEARRLGLVPEKEGEYAVVWGAGEVLEVWSPERWLAASNSAEVLARALREAETDADNVEPES
jgi:DNA-binding transcriptional regulator/RsmH inhibitor MraZ